MIPVYRAAAPAIGIVAPDIYMKESPKVARVVELYRKGGPLLVPELGNDPVFARYFSDIFGAQSLGVVPFGIDHTATRTSRSARRTSTRRSRPSPCPSACWGRWRGSGRASASRGGCGAPPSPMTASSRTLDLGRWTATLSFNEWQFGRKEWWPDLKDKPAWPPYPSGGALIAQLGPDEFLLGGQRVRVSFDVAPGRQANGLIFASVEEGHLSTGDGFVPGSGTATRPTTA